MAWGRKHTAAQKPAWSQDDYHTAFASKIKEQIEQGVAPWQKPYPPTFNSIKSTKSVKGGPKLDHGGGGKLDHPARWTACLRVAVRPGWSGGWARLWAGPDGAEARLHSQQLAKGGVRTPERQRRGGRACCVRGDSCRRSAPECGRDGSTGRAARRSAGQSRRSRSIR